MRSLLITSTNKAVQLLCLLLIFSFAIVSCESEEAEEPIQSSGANELLSEEDIHQIGIAHNLGLDAIIRTSNFDSHFDSFNRVEIKSVSDTLALLRFLQEESLIFIKEHKLLYRGRKIDTNNFQRFGDEELLILARVETTHYTKKQTYYYELLKKALAKHIFSPLQLREEVTYIIKVAKQDVTNIAELNPILIMGGVLISSHEYWADAVYTPISARDIPCATIEALFDAAVADVAGGASGATLGSVAPGIGTVIVGITGALLGSSSTYAYQLAKCGLSRRLFGGHGGSSGNGSGVGGNSGGSSGYDPGSGGGWKSGQNGSWEIDDPCDKKRNKTSSVLWGRTATVVNPCK